jgi:hypothetical protein
LLLCASFAGSLLEADREVKFHSENFPNLIPQSFLTNTMGDASVFTYPSPLTGYENAPPLSDEKAADGKSYVNPPAERLSDAYEKFIDPLDRSERGAL